MKELDVLVVGSGIAGLTFALKVAEQRSVTIITKKDRAESNTNYAQGGVACVSSREDSFEEHIQDTLEAGAGLCREEVVRTIIQEGPPRVHELMAWGMSFMERECDGEKQWDLGQEGGHSKRRILHAKDVTGREIERTLLQAVAQHPRITVLEDHLAVNLVTTKKGKKAGPNRCLGMYVLDNQTGEVKTLRARHTLLATGGCGKTYLYTTNPDIATGDGVAMAYRAGARVANMEFIQFHPTCLYHPKKKSFLISEAVRGEGGVLVDGRGHSFMEKYHERKSLAPRDVVARAIDAEMKKSGAPCVFLDSTHHSSHFLKARFPTIYQTCLSVGMDMAKDPIPVVPAAHYQCGGVLTDLEGQTDLEGLWAVGEVACTGLHGANRLASNSLLEALVVAHRAAHQVLNDQDQGVLPCVPDWEVGSAVDHDELVVISHNWQEIRQLMWDYVGIVRTTKRLMRAQTRLLHLAAEVREYYWDYKLTADLIELRSLVLVASLIVDSALSRHESRGLHFTLDYPYLASGKPQETVL